MKAPEAAGAEVAARHRLTSLHLFTAQGVWRIFGFRKDAKGYEASVESGEGGSILEAIENLNARLIEGPIRRKPAALTGGDRDGG